MLNYFYSLVFCTLLVLCSPVSLSFAQDVINESHEGNCLEVVEVTMSDGSTKSGFIYHGHFIRIDTVKPSDRVFKSPDDMSETLELIEISLPDGSKQVGTVKLPEYSQQTETMTEGVFIPYIP